MGILVKQYTDAALSNFKSKERNKQKIKQNKTSKTKQQSNNNKKNPFIMQIYKTKVPF